MYIPYKPLNGYMLLFRGQHNSQPPLAYSTSHHHNNPWLIVRSRKHYQERRESATRAPHLQLLFLGKRSFDFGLPLRNLGALSHADSPGQNLKIFTWIISRVKDVYHKYRPLGKVIPLSINKWLSFSFLFKIDYF